MTKLLTPFRGNHFSNRFLQCVSCLVCLTVPTCAQSLRNLSDIPTKNRFPVTAITWPANPGDAQVCLWKGDKTAALSITIDDNTAPQADEWLTRAKPLDFPLTWFVIVTKVGTGAYWGTWESWKKVLDAGQDVQSHTMAHLNTTTTNWAGIQWEYEQSQQDLESKIPGNKVRFLAYPGGTNSKLNDRDVAAKYYLAARGTKGTINSPSRIDYLNVSAMSGATLDNPAAPFCYVPNILDSKSQYYRGWAVILFHRVEDWNKAQAFLDFYKTNQDQIWGCTFGDAAIYGQERDTAQLKSVQSDADHIRLTLTDSMDDAFYNHPLTLKVRLPKTWNTAVARQDGATIHCSIVEHEGERYALADAVPDKGEILLENAQK